MTDKPELTRLARQLQRWGCRGTEEEIVELVEPELRALSDGVGEGYVKVPRADIEHLMEYWNGNRNDSAMWDALNYIIAKLSMFAPASPEGRGDGWISVDERLPDSIGSYLVFNVNQMSPNEIGWAFFSSDKKWCRSMGHYSNVTYWQPLPPAPAGAKERA